VETHGSGVLARGVLVDGMKASSKAGRYLLDKEREVLAALHDPTPEQLLLVTTYVRGEWTLYQHEQRVLIVDDPSRQDLRLLYALRAQQDRTYERLFGRPRPVSRNRAAAPAHPPSPADVMAEMS
jgi:hypothetical protein